MLAVQCQNIEKVYSTGDSKTHALRGISLEVNSGELLMLVGPSGCGKTTLISIIAGILDSTSGSCIVLGEDLKRMSNSARTEFRGKNIGFVFQSYNLIPTLTISENVAVPLIIGGTPFETARKKAVLLLERIGLKDKVNEFPSNLSGGQQQRVAIARALIHEPHLIVCDEPTAALDHETGQIIMELFKEVAIGPDRTLIIVTHDNRIFNYADRIIHLDDGQVVDIKEEKL